MEIIDSKDIFTIIYKEHRQRNKEKLLQSYNEKGTLRAGTSGCVDGSGKIYGACPRYALARYLGYTNVQEKPEETLMMVGGLANENIMTDWLKRYIPYEIASQNNARITWNVAGTNVVITPDFLFVDGGRVMGGMELKRASSVWTVHKTGFKYHPKDSHLIQSAVNFWRSGSNGWMLGYVQDVNYQLPAGQWVQRDFPPEHEYTVYQGTYPFNINPHFDIYDLAIDTSGNVFYKHYSKEEWSPSLITTHGIQRFYELVLEMIEKKFLPKKPNKKCAAGGKDKSSTECKYCEFDAFCKKEPTYGQFVENVDKARLNAFRKYGVKYD